MKGQDQKKKNGKNPTRGYAFYSGLALQMLAIIGIGTFFAVKAGNYFSEKTSTFVTAMGVLAAVLIAVVYTVRQIITYSNKDQK